MKKDKSNNGEKVGIEVEMDEETAKFYSAMPQGLLDIIFDRLCRAFIRANEEYPDLDWGKIVEDRQFEIVASDNQGDQIIELEEKSSLDLHAEASLICSFLASLLDILSATNGDDLMENTISSIAYKGQEETEKLKKIIDIFWKRLPHESKKAA